MLPKSKQSQESLPPPSGPACPAACSMLFSRRFVYFSMPVARLFALRPSVNALAASLLLAPDFVSNSCRLGVTAPAWPGVNKIAARRAPAFPVPRPAAVCVLGLD